LEKENFVLKKKRECEREEEEEDPLKGIGRKMPPMLTSYTQYRASASMTPYSPPWRPRSKCLWRTSIMMTPCSAPRAAGSRYEKYFLRDLFIIKN
jgi:hypothetical protein